MFRSGGVVLPKNSSLVASAWQETDASAIEARPSARTIRFKRALSTTLKPGNDANTDGSYHAKTKFIKTKMWGCQMSDVRCQMLDTTVGLTSDIPHLPSLSLHRLRRLPGG